MASPSFDDGSSLGPGAKPAEQPPVSSTAESSLISEGDTRVELESKVTTPSTSPQNPGNLVSHDEPEGSTLAEREDRDEEITGDAPVPPADDDNESVDSAIQNEVIAHRLRNVASKWRSNKNIITRAKPPPGIAPPPPPPDPDVTNIKVLRDHLTMMEWVTGLLEDAPSVASTASSNDVERVKCIPELKGISLFRWNGLPPPPGWKPSDYAITYLAAEPQGSQRYTSFPRTDDDQEASSSAAISQAVRPHGIGHLPPQIRIYSLAVRKILTRLTDGKLGNNGYGVFVTIFRPYKVLVYHEQAIREQLLLLENLCVEAGKTASQEDLNQQDGTVNVDASEDTEKHLDHQDGLKDVSDNHEQNEQPQTEVDRSSTASDKSALPYNLLFTHTNWQFHSHKELLEAHAEWSVLVGFMDKYVFPLRQALRDEDDMRVRFSELWHLYVPGDIVFVKDPNVTQKLWRVVQGTGGAPSPVSLPAPPPNTAQLDYLRLGGAAGIGKMVPFTLDCYYLDFDGTHFVRVLKKFEIEEFKDLASIKSLPILPLSVAEREDMVDTKSLRQRGERFIAYTQPTYCYYKGRSLSHDPEGGLLRQPERGSFNSVVMLSEIIESPVVIDFERCLQTIPDWKPCKTPRELSVPFKHAGVRPVFDDDRGWDLRMAEDVLNYTDLSQPLGWNSRSPPTGDEILLLPDRVFAYILRTRRWACLPLSSGEPHLEENSLTPMEEDKLAWNYLQIDGRHKTIIKSMMETHFRKKKSDRRQFDIIRDKGKGLIVLLHGVPGVGKTSTAETVAQYYNKPLLPITCGDLGMTPTEVEANLQSSFQLAQAWECVLLLDEADVFLAERSQDSIERNALVSVFLRVMEYYEGILFLTTNKVGSFDEAFKSRMSMALYYPPLSQSQTEKIWEVQMQRTEELSIKAAPKDESQHVKFDTDDVMEYSKELWWEQQRVPEFRPVWNGRQIRNAFQTAVALAESHQHEHEQKRSQPIYVTKDHFKRVAAVSNQFNAYLWEVKHSREDATLTWKKGHRADHMDPYKFAQGNSSYGHQQQQSGVDSWGNSQPSNMAAFGGQSGMGMGGPGYGAGSAQNQNNFGNNWQANSGGVGNSGSGNAGMYNVGVGNSMSGSSMMAQGISGHGMGNQSMGNQPMGNQPMGNQPMVTQAMGFPGTAAQGMVPNMHPGAANFQGIPGQNMPGQNMPGQNMPGQNMPGQNMPGQNMPGQNMPGQQ
ncbi:AAA family ATPase [Colletotrichum kahawae]|uniref:AAA family ATPase n=1 Tax=Colletotrichum kahawae TaxID=34407 RepID=A0AAD9Y6C3_COLKA|nr:AAA family ATPase [Colletotrichum kahawae]